MMSFWQALTISLFSGGLAYAASTYCYLRYERRKEKLAILRALMGARHGLTPRGSAEAKERFLDALNSAFAVFHDSPSVVRALQDFKKHTGRSSDNVTQLLRRISEELKIDTRYLEDDFFDEPFTPNGGT